VPDRIVVSAHLDDAVLSAYAVLSPAASVLTVFAGFPPRGALGAWDAEGGATDSWARIAERREEDRSALELSGAGLVHLDFPDSQYVALGVAPAPTLDALVAALRPYLDEAREVFAPSGLSANRRWRRSRRSDHTLVRDAVLEVRPDATLYADLPYALHRPGGFALPRAVSGANRREERSQLADELAAQKIEAVRCYRTQLRQLVERFGDFITLSGLGSEVYWARSDTDRSDRRTISATRAT
jgi:LmbE family N-acetylglucosaminyl deacetylase